MENVKIYLNNIIDFINRNWEDYEILNEGISLWRKSTDGYYHKSVKFQGKLHSNNIHHVMDMMNNLNIKKQISLNSVLPIENIQKINQIKKNNMDISLYYQDNIFPWPFSKRYAYLITMTYKISNDHYIYIEKTIDYNDNSIIINDSVQWNYTNTISYEKKYDHILTTMTCKFDLGETKIPVIIMDYVIKKMAVLYSEWNKLL